MAKRERVETRIFRHGKGGEGESRGISQGKASKALKANAAGKDVEPARLKAAKNKAKDHYAAAADEAAKRKRWW